ncbi:MAG: prolipoprotein diacylglyceryl transferase, partial [Citricoccus sp.]
QELFGGPTTLPWGLQVSADHPNFPAGALEGTLFHPTFLYEMVWNLAGVALLLILDRRLRLRRGMMLWSYVAWYTAGRTWIEMLRIDDAEMITLFGVTQRLNVWTSLLMFLIAIGFLIYLTVTRPRAAEARAAADSVWRPGREPGSAADVSGDAGSADEGDAESTVNSALTGDDEKVNAFETKKSGDRVENPE